LTDLLVHLVRDYGLLAVFVLMVAESCGLPFPSEIIMPAAGLLAAAGHVNLGLAILIGTAGNLCGSLLAYWLAARFGEPLLLGPGRRVGIRPHHLEIADGWFQRHGLWAVGVGRVLPVVRTYISFPAGLARVNPLGFSLATALGALPWCAALGVSGYLLGANYDRVSGPVGRVAVVFAAVLVLTVALWMWRGRRPDPKDA